MNKPVIDRLWEQTVVYPDSQCWRWVGYSAKGYGRIMVNHVNVLVHRLSASLHLGFDLTSDKLICHKPDVCKFSECWNPDHIYVGDHASNQADVKKLGHHSGANKTHCPYGHELTTEKFGGGRKCRTCDAKRHRDARRAKRTQKQ